MTCPEITELLRQIAATDVEILNALTGAVPGYRGSVNGWSYLKVGKSYFYERTVTYTGAAQSVDLDFPSSIQLNRVEQVWNDATSRDVSIRLYTDPALTYYVELDSQTSYTALSRIVQAGAEYKYPAGSRLRMYYANNTAAKTVTIRIQVDVL